MIVDCFARLHFYANYLLQQSIIMFFLISTHMKMSQIKFRFISF